MKKITMVLLLAALCSTGYADENDDLYTKWYEKGINRVEQGNLKDARECFRFALYYRPDDANAEKGFDMATERLERKVAPAPVVAERSAAAPIPNTPIKKKDSKDFSIRVAIGNAPGIDEGEILWSEFPIEDDTGSQIEVLAVQRFWSRNSPSIGGVLGGGVFFSNNSGTDAGSTDTFDLTAFGIMGQGGVAGKLGQHVVLELVPFVGVGGASVEITGFTDGSAPYFLYGVKGGVFILLGESIELGLEVAYQEFSSEVELKPSTADLTLSGSGVRGAVVLAIKF